ncbi:VOC family protein [Mesorhizobium sp. B2-6-2]|uniref:VOC family protein n=1 Tax=Mesorhizobium sp. B2-6-2 TaxID=2589915 RepID=UPI00112B153C|nr:VOC family protein [Mesorhizobium sp. B2-6-2]TPJ78456.1 VOC family protein [Mesorhizobium sp. B2-6-2]
MSGFAEQRSIATVALVVANYDEAIAWYVERLGFLLIEDVDLGGGKRWVTVAPAKGMGAQLLLAEASGEEQASRIGNQTGGRVFLFLETDDFSRDHQAMLAKGVEFREAPRFETYGTVAVFADLYGNLWDLIEPKRQG